MRLLDVKAVLERERDIQCSEPKAKVLDELDDKTAKYAILSHRWGKVEDEVSYDEMTGLMRMDNHDRNEVRQRAGYKKIIDGCRRALQDGYGSMWIDTCCIDKRSSSELSEAINSMYRWFQNAQVCYAYLSDVSESTFPTKQDFNKFGKSNGWPEWFSRGWTLQELIAPKRVKFFNRDWLPLSGKENLVDTLEKITRIPIDVLKDGRIPRRVCVAEIMSWAADRKTTREEDRAYSLLGLFGIHMPMCYGEGGKAFQRLQLEIIRVCNDHSIFAWNPKGQFDWVGGVLASDLGHFRGCRDIEKVESDEFVDELTKYSRQNRLAIARMMCNFSGKLACLRSGGRALREQLAIFLAVDRGIQICLPVIPHRDSASVFRAILACRDYYGNLITIDFKSSGVSSYRIPATRRIRKSRPPELRIHYLAWSAPYSGEECHHFKLHDTLTSYHGFTRRGTFPHMIADNAVTLSSLINDFIVVVYASHDSRHLFAVGLAHYLGTPSVHVVCDESSANQEVPWTEFAKKVYDTLWSAPVEDFFISGVKCAHLPRTIWDSKVVWYSGNVQTHVMVDVEQCSGCCVGPRECTAASNDWDRLDLPGFMKTVHNFRGLKLDGKRVWLCECSGQRIALGDYGDYSSGNFKSDGNIFEDMQMLGIDPADPAYRPVASRVSGDADVLDGEQDRNDYAVEFRLQDRYLTLHSPKGFSLPNNPELVLLLKALATRLAGKYLVATVIQCSYFHSINVEGGRGDSEGDSASKTGGQLTESGVVIPLCTIASPQVWRLKLVCARRREQYKSIRKHFYTLTNLRRPPGAEAGHESVSRRKKHGAVTFLSDIFGLENLKNYVGEVKFFERLHLMVETQSRGETSVGIVEGDGLTVRPATSLRNPFRSSLKSRAPQNPCRKLVVPPLLQKCEAFGPLVEWRRYLVARQQTRCEVKSISQTLSVGLLQHIYTAILDASVAECQLLKDQSSHSDYAKEINLRAMLQEITVLQTKLDATDDEDEQQALEEDVTGKVLWLSWCGILSEVKQRLPEVVEYIQRDGDSMTPEGRDRFRQGLREIGDIIKKTPHVHLDDDLAHLRRIMLDAGAGVSKHALWLVAQAAEQNKWSSTPILKEDYPAIPPRFMEHADTNYRANSEH